MLVDNTGPPTPLVTDDGAFTASTTQLHASWSANDPESGIVESQYQIRRDSITGTIIVNWTSTGTATSVTRTGLSLLPGVTYYVLVKAKNGAGLWSGIGNSDGITVQSDVTPPIGTISINGGAAYTTIPAVTLTLSATDDAGPVTQMQFSNGGVTYSAPEAYATSKRWTLPSGDGQKTVSVKFQDAVGNWSTPASDSITVDTTAPSGTITSPSDGAVLGAQ